MLIEVYAMFMFAQNLKWFLLTVDFELMGLILQRYVVASGLIIST